MENDFKYDVFLSHSSKDKSVVRPLAERLRADGLRVWFNEWVLKPTFQPSAFILQPFLDAPIKGSLAQFLYIIWLLADREQGSFDTGTCHPVKKFRLLQKTLKHG